MPEARSAAVDSYIANARPFAQPILVHLREVVHQAVPEVEEAIKWSMPFFLVRGVILGNMAAHKEHASFGLWGQELVAELRSDKVATGENMGSFGRICSLSDLPDRPALEGYLRKAAALISEGKRTRSLQRVVKPQRAVPALPAELARALEGDANGRKSFEALAPSCRREYIDWIGGAKREVTRKQRAATAVGWILEGKGRNWKYERPS